MEIPMIIKRCLSYGVQIYPYQLNDILLIFDKYCIPDINLESFNKVQLEKYIKALYLCSMEDARDWSKGHESLKELGFKSISNINGHRNFISLKYG